MKVSDIPFNMQTNFNSAYHEQPVDIDEMIKGVDFLISKIESERDQLSLAILHTLAGHFLRVLSRSQDAFKHFKIAYKFYHDADDKIREIDLIYRMAVVHYYENEYSKCDNLFLKVLDLSSKYPHHSYDKFLHNVYFYLGLSKKSQGSQSMADGYFSKCLEARIVKGNIALINQCQELIKSIHL